jgi:hypothetical protein
VVFYLAKKERIKMKLYVIGGKAKSGKNTFGKFIREELKEYGYKPCVMHLTEPLYSYAENYFEWNEHSNEKPREFLQKMGVEIIKEKLGKKTFLLDRLAEDIEILSEFFDTFIIVDARLKQEFEYFKKKYDNVTTIRLERTNYKSGLSAQEASHITETDLDDYNDFDYVVTNDGLVEFKKDAKEVVKREEGLKNA